MRFTVYNNERWFFGRLRRGLAELVHPKTSETITVPATNIGPIIDVHQQLVPAMVPFADRDPSFVSELQQRRLQALLDNQNKRRSINKSKNNESGGSVTRRRSASKDKQAAMMAELVKLSLGGKTS